MDNTLRLVIEGSPQAKKRARKGRSGRWYNPSSPEMDNFKQLIRLQIPVNFDKIEKDIPISIKTVYYFEPAKYKKTKKFLDLIKNDDYPCIKHIDLDNLNKFIYDICNNFLWHDDCQVYKESSEKYWSLNTRTEIEVKWISDREL